MSQQELLKKIVDLLEQNGIDYIVSGSVVSSLQGEPRSTHDIDIVIHVDDGDRGKLVRAFPSTDYYLSEDTMADAIRRRTMFNLIEMNTAEKVDFWILTEEPFDQSRFQRRVFIEAFGLRFPVTSPEDTILAKLRWAKLSGGSEKQFQDALRVYEVQFQHLDMDYLREWADILEVTEMLEKLVQQAEVV